MRLPCQLLLQIQLNSFLRSLYRFSSVGVMRTKSLCSADCHQQLIAFPADLSDPLLFSSRSSMVACSSSSLTENVSVIALLDQVAVPTVPTNFLNFLQILCIPGYHLPSVALFPVSETSATYRVFCPPLSKIPPRLTSFRSRLGAVPRPLR